MNLIVNIASNVLRNKIVQQRTQLALNGKTNSGEDPYVVANLKEEQDHEAFTMKNEELSLQFGGSITTSEGFFGSPPIIKYSREKRLIKTEIGVEDEIIEEYGMGSYELDISGLLISDDHVNYPADKIEDLRKAFELPKEYEVVGKIFTSLGIDKIYLTGFSINGIIGYADTWEYTFKARSMKQMNFQLLSQN